MSVDSIIGVTGVEEDILYCEWIVRDLEELEAMNNRSSITSPDYVGKRNAWYFLFDPKRNWISVNLKDYEKVKKQFRAKAEYEIIDLKTNQKWISDEDTATYGSTYHYRSLPLPKEAQQITQSENGFKMICRITEMNEMSMICAETEKFNSRDTLCNYKKSLLLCDEFSDVKILAKDGREFNVHKVMISRSPVFKQMLLSNLTETNSSEIRIDDISGDALEKMIKFIYQDEVEDDDSIDCEYLLAAHKYDLPLLTAKYGTILAKKANIETCIHLLILGEMTKCDELRAPLMQFVASNRRQIANKDWQLLAKEQPHLMATIIAMC